MNKVIEKAVAYFIRSTEPGLPTFEGESGERHFLRLWKEASTCGLTRVGIPEAYGGWGGGGPEMGRLLSALTRQSQSIGFSMALMISQIIAHFMIASKGTDEQKDAWLPPMAEGRFPSAFAVSEAKVGAHPARLKTRGEKKEGDWILNGEKSYISNGPLAGLVVLVAVVGEEENGRKRFNTFLVPGKSYGMDHSGVMDLPFFKPAQHGTLELNGVCVGPESVLGAEGSAYTEQVLPFRRYEDAMIMACATGGLEALLGDLVQRAKSGDASVCDLLGRFAARKIALEYLALRCAELTKRVDSQAVHETEGMVIHFREAMGHCIEEVKGLLAQGLTLTPVCNVLLADLEAAQGIGATLTDMKRKRMGRELIKAI